VLIEIEGTIQRRLTTHGGQQGIRPLLLDNARNHLPGDRLNIGGIRHRRIGHDGRGI